MKTMNNMKKFASILLALVMVLAMAAPAMAATITIEDGNIVTGASYSAYKLLNATNAVDAEGNGTEKFAYTVNGKYQTALQEVTSKSTDADIVAYIAALDTNGIRTFADAIYAKVKTMAVDATATENVFSNVDQGYYLIVETAAGTTGEQYGDDVISLVMLDTAGEEDVTVNTKESVPTVEKKVTEKNDSTGITSTGDSADYDVGDNVPFTITGTVSSQYANYKTYSYLITDTMDAGLTYNEDAKIYVVNDDIKVEVTDSFTITKTTNGFTATADLKNLKDSEDNALVNASSKIIVEYTATLNSNAVSGTQGNKNSVKLTYNRDPYYDGTGTPNTGDTPEDTNVVFTYNVIVNKVDKDGNALAGAGFTLYKWVETAAATETTDTVYNWAAVGNEITGVTTFNFNKLDEGKYKLVETTVPAGYNKAADVEFEIVSTLTGEQLTALVVKDSAGNTISGTGEDAIFNVTLDTDSSDVTTNVQNLSGTELPETGGMGTTLIYAVGALLVAGAVVVMISKKRAASK